jgi:hypothetical protein|tara:strand:+ start:366 stop:686 length:321 start_codon:yes stop_codon:yes gene_type:complete
MKIFRLTVHVTNRPKIDTKAPEVVTKRKGPQKSAVDLAMQSPEKGQVIPKAGRFKIYNTLSFYCDTIAECMDMLYQVRSKYDIQIGRDHTNPSKYKKELYNISFAK